MEMLDPHEAVTDNNLLKRVVASFIAGIRFVGRQLALADLSPHEGMLRSSVKPNILVPDFPPVHDDTIITPKG